jgi:hypothetical protein
MPVDLDSLDPHDEVRVTPRYLAGAGDPGTATTLAWPGLLKAGWSSHTPPHGELLCTSPCQRIRAGCLPESAHGPGHWRTAAYTDPFAAPRWNATWSAETPVELIGNFHQALGDAYAAGAFDSLSTHTSPTAVYLPLLIAGWDHGITFDGDQKFTATAGYANLTCYYRPHNGKDKWRLTAGFRKHDGAWSATFSQHVPLALVAAFTTALADEKPLTRTVGQLPLTHRSYLATELAQPTSATPRHRPPVTLPPVPATGNQTAGRSRS